MAAKRSARKLAFEDSKKSGRHAGTDDEWSGKSGQGAVPSPLKRAEERSLPSGVASPATGGRLPVDSSHDSKRAATPKRGVKRSPPPRQGDERLEKRAAGADADTVAAKSPKRKKKGNRSMDKNSLKKKKKKQQIRKIAEQELAGVSSPPHDEQQEDDEETRAQEKGKALQLQANAPSTKLCGSETKKKPVAERSWSHADELKILNALAESHDGDLPKPSHLMANLTFDKLDADEEKLANKIRKLRTRYHGMLAKGCPSDRHARQLFKLFNKIWGQVDEDEQVDPTSRDFNARSELYPHLAKEVKAYDEVHSSGHLLMPMFITIDDEKARDLDAKCKKQQIGAMKLELGQARLINELLSASQHIPHGKNKVADNAEPPVFLQHGPFQGREKNSAVHLYSFAGETEETLTLCTRDSS